MRRRRERRRARRPRRHVRRARARLERSSPMSRPTPHLCAEPGCPTVVDGAGRCAEHGSTSWDRWRCSDEGRRRSQGYGWRWTRARNAYLAAHPGCERCGAGADEVHHRDGRLPTDPGANDWRNLEALCRRCHRRARSSSSAAAGALSPPTTTAIPRARAGFPVGFSRDVPPRAIARRGPTPPRPRALERDELERDVVGNGNVDAGARGARSRARR